MLESLVLFESVINSRWFLRTSIILLLTKIDVFQNKLLKVCFIVLWWSSWSLSFEKVPLERCFPEYTGGADINKAAKYILWKFMQANRARLSVYPRYVAPPFVILLFPLTLWLVWLKRQRQIKCISDWYSLSFKTRHWKMRLKTHGSYDPWASRVVSSGLIFSPSFISLWNFAWLSSLSFTWWVPLFHRYFGFPSFRLSMICPLWRFSRQKL